MKEAEIEKRDQRTVDLNTGGVQHHVTLMGSQAEIILVRRNVSTLKPTS